MVRLLTLLAVTTALSGLPMAVHAEDAKPASEFPDFKKTTEGAEVLNGLFKLYRVKEKLLVELPTSSLGKEYMFLLSLSRGIAEGGLLGGMSLNFHDDWILSFKRVGDRIHVIRKNVRFRADKGTPEERAVQNSYTDSVLAALPIATVAPSGAVLIDLGDICMTDFVGLSKHLTSVLRSHASFDRSRSTYRTVKAFPENVEIDVAAVYGGSQAGETDNVPDTRGVQLGIHYSISELPQNDYKPRLADSRIGYFVTAVKDFTKTTTETAFVRYITRWKLEKADSTANPSPPKKPIRFYIEDTVPYRWRPYVKEGILAWNRAFDKLGFSNAIEVLDLPSDADPEDVRYNTFRWITTGHGFAMGPSRVNAYTGQILDADIIFDADMIRHWQLEYDDLIETRSIAARPKKDASGLDILRPRAIDERNGDPCRCGHCGLGDGLREQIGLLSIAHLAATPDGKPLSDTIIGEAVREVTMHEVGHTLGLRHNFKASTWKSLEEINNAKFGEPTVGSVMDYNPANIQPKGKPQGHYFPTAIGPWDEWVIEYGYSIFSSGEDAKKLAEIAAKAPKPELVYATDEDTHGDAPDPNSNLYDLGSDPIAHAKQQQELAKSLLPTIMDKVVKDGEGYEKLRRAFSMLVRTQLYGSWRATRFIGGQYFSRNHKGDAGAKPPFVPVSGEKQREAMAYIRDNLFSDGAVKFPPELLNYLAPNRWLHWGTNSFTRADYPLHEMIFRYQSAVLSDLFDPIVLDRMRENEYRAGKDDKPFTLPELYRSLSDSIFTELAVAGGNEEAKNAKIAISSLRRPLQREYVRRLIDQRLSGNGVPDDARSLASLHLKELKEKIGKVKANAADDYAKAHLLELEDRIDEALDADFQLRNP